MTKAWQRMAQQKPGCVPQYSVSLVELLHGVGVDQLLLLLQLDEEGESHELLGGLAV